MSHHHNTKVMRGCATLADGADADPSLRRRWADAGASLVEYALLVGLIAVVCIGALTYFGGASGNSADNSASCIVGVGGNCP